MKLDTSDAVHDAACPDAGAGATRARASSTTAASSLLGSIDQATSACQSRVDGDTWCFLGGMDGWMRL